MKPTLDPRYGNVHLDANALDRNDSARSNLVDELLILRRTLPLSLVMPKGVRLEIENPHTPDQVRADMPEIFTLDVNLNTEEARRRSELMLELTGNSSSQKHHADADHIFEAAKNGGRYFITHDQRILRKRAKILEILKVPFDIVTLEEFVKICRTLS